jgi:hypothetical protein
MEQRPSSCAALIAVGILVVGMAAILGLGVRVFMWVVGL